VAVRWAMVVGWHVGGVSQSPISRKFGSANLKHRLE